MSLLDDAFHLLEAATRLQKEGPEKNRIESATKVRTISIYVLYFPYLFRAEFR